jgi:hypothetical protein
MTAVVSSLVLIGVFGGVAASAAGLVVALYRVTNRKRAD